MISKKIIYWTSNMKRMFIFLGVIACISASLAATITDRSSTVPTTQLPLNEPQTNDVVDVDEVIDERDDSDVGLTDSKHPECLTQEGVLPNWHDSTCNSYIVCEDFVPSLMKCPQHHVFSVIEGQCVNESLFSCSITNGAFQVIGDTLKFLRGNVGGVFGRTKRSTDKNTNKQKGPTDTIHVPLPSQLCRLVSYNTNFLESNLNQLLLTNAKCPGNVCKMPLLSLSCVDEDEDDTDENDDDENNNTDENDHSNMMMPEDNEDHDDDDSNTGSDNDENDGPEQENDEHYDQDSEDDDSQEGEDEKEY